MEIYKIQDNIQLYQKYFIMTVMCKNMDVRQFPISSEKQMVNNVKAELQRQYREKKLDCRFDNSCITFDHYKRWFILLVIYFK